MHFEKLKTMENIRSSNLGKFSVSAPIINMILASLLEWHSSTLAWLNFYLIFPTPLLLKLWIKSCPNSPLFNHNPYPFILQLVCNDYLIRTEVVLPSFLYSCNGFTIEQKWDILFKSTKFWISYLKTPSWNRFLG